MLLEKINSPKDIKELSIDELNILAEEVREAIISKVKVTGGHLSSNLGLVEAEIALHYVFNSPVDKFVFDVSHQSYTHKILTGRKEGYTNPTKYSWLSGFTTPSESEHDMFKVGHTSTSISLACGLAKARDIKGNKENIIAIIGDGSLSGGEAFEGLDNAATLNSNFIVLFNDNEMSIAENHGAIYENLKLLRESNGTAENNYYKIFGYDYYYLEDGNDIGKLIELFNKVKDTNKPTVLHIHTLKGKGLEEAVNNKEATHGYPAANADPTLPTMEKLTVSYLLNKMQENKELVVINAATPGAHGWNKTNRELSNGQYIDVGITEQHAATFASGLAKGGIKAIWEVTSSFSQRAYDQINQDIAMNDNPAVILVHFGKIAGGDCTHNGMFDISFMSNIPNIVCLAPTNKEDYFAMLDYAIDEKEHPIIIRVPNQIVSSNETSTFDNESIYKSKIKKQGSQVALFGLGDYYTLAEEVDILLKESHIDCTIVDPINYSQIDTETLDNIAKTHKLIVTLENGVLDGGYGQKVASYLGTSNCKVLNFGAKKAYNDLVPLNKVLESNNLTAPQIANIVLQTLQVEENIK